MREKLSEMNPFAKVECDKMDSVESLIKEQKPLDNYSAIVYGLRTFSEAIGLNNLAKKKNIPFYCLNSSGPYGFFYADIGKNVEFTAKNMSTQ